jgi:hypothetical protein
MNGRLTIALATAVVVGCGGGSGKGGGGGGGAGGGMAPVGTVVISTATRKPRMTTWSVNYWQWAPSYGDYVTGTDALIAAVHPAVMRVGGYNNDANTPDPFGDAQLDTAVAYARAIGAEPLIQVPRLANPDGTPPTPDDAAAMVRYANVTKAYAIKYFSVGNEPDLYDAQGLPTDATKPAIPGYTAADFCAATRAYVTAMKAVDPTIQIVGPDLAYKYQIGNASNDWLSPILESCGDLFDVVAIHRYPFSSDRAAASLAAVDAAAFKTTIASVRGAMQAKGYGGKPLAITEMNVAYNATSCVLDASPGTVGGAVWLADVLGTSIGLDLWSSVVWNISDAEDWSLGLIGALPAHRPRPAYYAYALYADHFGPTVLPSVTAPPRVGAYASRNAADDATQVIAVNWNGAAQGLTFQVTGLASGPPSPTFVLPALSMAAVEIKDSGDATAWVYGEAQRQVGAPPQGLAAGTSPGAGGAGGGGAPAGKTVGVGCPTDGGSSCPQMMPQSPTITTMGTMSGTQLVFGPPSAHWKSYSYAAAGQTAPVGQVTADGNGLTISGGFVVPVNAAANYIGLGFYFDSASCVDASSYQGISFDFAGDLGGCKLAVGALYSGDASATDNPGRGTCAGTSSTCYPPSADVTAAALAATTAAPSVKVPFPSFAGGSPISSFDRSTIITVQWQLASGLGVTDGGACAAAFSVSNVAFY